MNLMTAMVVQGIPAPHIGLDAVLFRLVLSGIFGAIVGLERQTHGRAAGLRTMMLVGLGCCLVMITSNSFVTAYWGYRGVGENLIRIDPARLAYGVMAGIGFLGAGTILKSGFNIRGLTTAATIWCIAAIGLSVGMGLYFAATVTTALVLFALYVLDHVEDAMPTQWYKTIEIELPNEPDAVGLFREKIEMHQAKVLDLILERRRDNTMKITYRLSLPDKKHVLALFNAIAHEPQVTAIRLTDSIGAQ